MDQMNAKNGGAKVLSRPRKSRIGIVASNKGTKTIKVACDYSVKHRKYGKYLQRRSGFHAHDPKNEARVGDQVEIMACRPISKTKSWRLVRIVRRLGAAG